MKYSNIDTNRSITVSHSISTEELKELASHDHFPSITIYTPTFRRGTEVKQNRVQIEKGVKAAVTRLVEMGMQQEFANQFVQPVIDLTQDFELMSHLFEGVVVFVSLSEVKLFTLPCSFATEVVIDNIFDLRQILICETTNPEFYLLHITENSVSLYTGDNTELRPIELPGSIPQSMDERFDLEERVTQTQVVPVASGGEAMMRGNVPLRDVEDKFIRKFIQDIEKGLAENIFPPNSHKPLIFAGDPTITAMYKQVTTYKNLLEETIGGNYEKTNPDELHSKAIEVMQRWLESQLENVIARYQELKGEDNTTANIAAILPAVYSGAVEALLIADNAEYKGEYDLQNNKLDVQSPTDHDLINEIIVQTILQNGRIFVVPREQMPDKDDIDAILRFPINMTAT